jgi:hypothetical protein
LARAAIRRRRLTGQLVTIEIASRFNDFLKLLPRPVEPDLGIVTANTESSADFLVSQPTKRAKHKDGPKGLGKLSDFAADAVAHFLVGE